MYLNVEWRATGSHLFSYRSLTHRLFKDMITKEYVDIVNAEL